MRFHTLQYSNRHRERIVVYGLINAVVVRRLFL
jgi:hypothetical protein